MYFFVGAYAIEDTYSPLYDKISHWEQSFFRGEVLSFKVAEIHFIHLYTLYALK